MQAAAFSDDAEQRCEHRGIVKWLNEVLNGAMMSRHEHDARQRLSVYEAPGTPDTGTPWMEHDGMHEELTP